jgi:hypothetical protein
MSIEQTIQANTQAMLDLTELLRGLTASGLKPIVVDETTVLPAKVAPLSEIAPLLQEVPVNNPAPEIEATPTIAELRGAFITMGEKCGKDSQLDLLKQFGAKKLGEVDPAQFGAVLKVINMMVEAANG